MSGSKRVPWIKRAPGNRKETEATLRGTIAGLKASLECLDLSLREGQSGNSSSNHLADLAQDVELRHDVASRRACIEVRPRSAQEALERIKAGTYGICGSCGQPVGMDRLEKEPSATRCVDCQAKMEGVQHGRRQ